MVETIFPSDTKTRILDAAVDVIRAKGYSGTTVDDTCRAADVTKGGFFHHFKSKEDLAVSAAEYFSALADRLFSAAPYQQFPDPLDRLLGYVDFRKAILKGEVNEFTCLLGTMVQETYQTHPEIRQACNIALGDHVLMLEPGIADAMRKYHLKPKWTAKSLAQYMQAVIQGAFILAKAEDGPQVAVACLEHLRRYLKMQFRPSMKKETR
jgi:TetR/AcrR family transcriptional regulator, transcriptional repressor for nem operon